MEWKNELSEKLQKGDSDSVVKITQEAINNKQSAEEILDAFLMGMGVIGVRFKNNEIFVPEVLIAARAMNNGMKLLEPLLQEEGVEKRGKIVIGTVSGDLHDIGKNLVGMMLVGSGFEVIDLGVDITADKFIEAAVENNADIICMSALLTTTMNYMKEVIDEINNRGLKFKVMVGGAPVTEDFAKEIGATAFSKDATSATEVAKQLLA